MSVIKSNNKGIQVDVSVYLYLDKDYPEGDMYAAYCPELDLVGYDITPEGARKSFEVVMKDYIDYSIENGTLEKDLLAHGWKKKKNGTISEPSYLTMFRNTELKNVMNHKEFSKFSVPVVV